jgi:CheY-like chemotaxis protein
MKLRILLVEDYQDCASSTAMLLRMWGHEVEVVADGLTAVEAAQTHQPEVVVLDIGLPGMDGWKVAERIHEQPGANRPLLIAVTGYGRECDIRHSTEAGIDVHLTKPADPDVLKSLLDQKQANSARLHSPSLLDGPQTGTALARFGPHNQGAAYHEHGRPDSCQADP